MYEFPPCFPENFEKEILPVLAKKQILNVYRIMKSGKIERDSFLSTYEEIERGLIPPKKEINLQEPDIYSTSCNLEYSDAEYLLSIFMRHHPKPIIAKGQTNPNCGPSQITKERKQRDDSHVDWWIYEQSNPQDYFEMITKKEDE